ncbi:D-alanyl-D-alanine carboxypeptidase/D-alanyl-D-alanine-endopeptidase [Bacteroides sp. 214]|uniref:D-alanyl-D-alanine carboxypeptidase/D-alanyl-D-alanine endopeptidase n=1 Tax=Bacteroides sp. 214 TaxID=2302935 RepID=UPI0013D88730|nr:D-alanyl-D-alanine carboxypeptidase/D-alanyl-D-alanine-endopeptidase [Bacteroides sp. 214]NDW13554.1 D-alanyl-D-alanine carboxypeptidase/D-alanyl-D-alanine-endopeptidase [Bacteroides sp. 214]
MNTRILLTLLVFSFGLLPAWGQASLHERIDKLLAEKLPEESQVGICIYNLHTKEYLYQYQEKKLCRPASNMKILTVLTALTQPDGEEPFRTNVWYKGDVKNNTLYGDLYVVGGYDPQFNDSSMNILVEEIAALPFSSIKGKIYGDVSMKDSLYWGSGWSWDDTPYYYQPYLTPLMFNKGIVEVTAKPNATGQPATLSLVPQSGFYTLINETKSGTPDADKFRVSRNWLENGNEIIVTGNVDRQRTGTVNMYTTQNFFMHTLVERLQQKGIELDSNYEYAEFTSDSTAVLVTCLEQTVDDVLRDIMKDSDNMATEALLCKIASTRTGKKKTSTEEGLEMIKELIEKVGHDPKKYELGDACGLSDYNLLSPALFVDLLKYAYADTDLFRKFYKTLPIGGADGTLKSRMGRGTNAYLNIAAKTGSISGISTLAGYAKTKNGHVLAFSIMNQNTLTSARARSFQDAICELLCE